MGVFQNLGGDWRSLLGFRIYFKRAVACKNLVGPTLIFLHSIVKKNDERWDILMMSNA